MIHIRHGACTGKFHILIMIAAAAVQFLCGCSSMDRMERYRPIMGYWETGREVIVSIHDSPDYGVGAFVMKAPGYLGPEAKPDAPVIVNIKPLSRYAFEGTFLMPDGSKSVKVELVLMRGNVLNIFSRDKRVKQRMMQWTRAGRR